MHNIYIETYGCSANQNDSEIMAGLLTRAGFHVIDDLDNADIVIVNTCTVKQPTESRVIDRILKLEKHFKNRIIVAGCMPAAQYEKIKSISNAALLGPDNIKNIVDVVSCLINGKRKEALSTTKDEKVCQPIIRRNQNVGIVQISHGCLSNCAYCITKLAKGDLFSYSADSIVKEIERAKQDGCKEFWLTSQDCGCYGLDKDDDNTKNLAALINEITGKVKGEYFLRIGMLNPLHVKNIINDLIHAYDNEHVFKFLHLPVQSGSDEVLDKMNRNYGVDDFKNIVKSFRRVFPNISIWTDIIVGFPGETEQDFQASLDLIRGIKPDFTNVSKFGARPGTKAAEMRQLPSSVVKQRSRIMSELVNKISLEQNKKWIGWSGRVIVDEYNSKNTNWVGRNHAYKPVVIKSKDCRPGEFLNVKIVDARATCLVGDADF